MSEQNPAPQETVASPLSPSQPLVAPQATTTTSQATVAPQAAAARQEPTAPQMPVSPQEPTRHKVHHSYIWLGSIHVMITVVFIAVASSFSLIVGFLSDISSIASIGALQIIIAAGAIIGGLVAVLIIAVLFHCVSYRHLFYELSAEEFNLYSGILNKKRVHVPYQRIQSVDQRANLLQRIFGVCSLSIDTAGGAANKAVVVPYVQKEQAEQLRTELFARKRFAAAVKSGEMTPEAASAAFSQASTTLPVAGNSQMPHNVLDAPAEIWDEIRGVFGGSAVDTGKVTYEYGLSNKELVLTSFSSNTVFVLMVIAVMGGGAQLSQLFNSNVSSPLNPFFGQVATAGVQLFGGNVVTAVVSAIISLMLLIWAISIATTCISFGGFRARRRDNRIEVERGLLQHHFQGVSIDRVQSVIIRQSFIRRIFGYCELSLGKIDAAADNGENQQNGFNAGFIIHPFVKMSRVPEILAGLVSEFADVPVESMPVAPVALRRALIRRGVIQGGGFWLFVFIGITQACFNAVPPTTAEAEMLLYYVNMASYMGYGVCFVLFILGLVSAVLWFRESSFSYNNRFMQISNGGLSRETVTFQRNKIQFGKAKTNPFQRKAKTITISARTAAGVGGTTIRLIDVREDDARVWLEWLKPQGKAVK